MNDFGYPQICDLCKDVDECNLEVVHPFYEKRVESNIRLMLIGQDPTIFKGRNKVKTVLMLDKENGQISRWLRNIFDDQFDQVSIYATNIVKCTFKVPPSKTLEGGFKYLTPFFKNCKKYVVEEIGLYKPHLVMTLGESTHKLFRTVLDQNNVPQKMQQAFSGNLIRASVQGVSFDYTPCLHIKTFRVADIYGDAVKSFKSGINSYFK
ncbi:uracil-DNA glycosylase family protein [Pelosinus sp. IPA-1]|uniref:uracil-DNA glycosylase family protein n=1 Tax=Pelosinus sp. IPA-1 TaxID=3029569 RepID=UPI0024361975|nr:uracil-DNA glycosylase family protein [Pelosinus sp. IPA-1]GMA98821.1 hypothetical protein PIPA1_16210 [Pelosinus sp. IPA-1]